MYQQHRDGAQDVDFLIGVLAEQHRHQRRVPRVLRVVLAAAAVGNQGMADDIFLLVSLERERELTLHALHQAFALKSRTMVSTLDSNCVSFTPAEVSMRREAIVAGVSAYLLYR